MRALLFRKSHGVHLPMCTQLRDWHRSKPASRPCLLVYAMSHPVCRSIPLHGIEAFVVFRSYVYTTSVENQDLIDELLWPIRCSLLKRLLLSSCFFLAIS